MHDDPITLIHETLQRDVPGILADAGLQAFDEYRDSPPVRSNDREMCVYFSRDTDTTDMRTKEFIIQCQLYGETSPRRYHYALMPFMKKRITEQLLGMERREMIDVDIWPIDRQTTTSFIYYILTFEDSLDDCEE